MQADGAQTDRGCRAMHGTVPTLDYDKAWLEVMQNETVVRLAPLMTVLARLS